MPAKRPEYLPGHYYHIYNRGAHRISIFREDDNYVFVLHKVKAYCRSLNLTPIAYCLLPNHYHFLIRQDGEHPAVEQEAYLLHLCRYIHANPVIHGLVADIAEWPYSNYLEWIGERDGTLVDREFVRAHFPTADSYREFVLAYLIDRRLPKELEAYLRDWEA